MTVAASSPPPPTKLCASGTLTPANVSPLSLVTNLLSGIARGPQTRVTTFQNDRVAVFVHGYSIAPRGWALSSSHAVKFALLDSRAL